MRIQSLALLGTLLSVVAAQAEPTAEVLPKWPSIESSPLAEPTRATIEDDGRPGNMRYDRSWILQKRASTTEEDAATTAEETSSATEEATASATEATSQDATTTAAETTSASTTTEASTTSTGSSTTSTSSTTSSTSTTSSATSTTSSTSQSTTSASTTSTKSTSTASKTSSTSTATSTISAEMREYNHRGAVAAIITFSIVGSIFVGYAIIHCLQSSRRNRKIAATKAAADARSNYSMVPLSDNPRPQSEVNLDRSSMMFATQSRADLSSIAYQGTAQPMTRPSSIAAGETLHQSLAPGTPSNTRPNFI